MKKWVSQLRKPANIIGLATLIVTSIGVFAGVQLLSDNVFKVDDCKKADSIGQNSNGGTVKNTIVCSGGSTITNVTQE